MTRGDFAGPAKSDATSYNRRRLWVGSSEICPYRGLRVVRDHPKFIEQGLNRRFL
jgi:hypothetical protein